MRVRVVVRPGYTLLAYVPVGVSFFFYLMFVSDGRPADVRAAAAVAAVALLAVVPVHEAGHLLASLALRRRIKALVLTGRRSYVYSVVRWKAGDPHDDGVGGWKYRFRFAAGPGAELGAAYLLSPAVAVWPPIAVLVLALAVSGWRNATSRRPGSDGYEMLYGPPRCTEMREQSEGVR